MTGLGENLGAGRIVYPFISLIKLFGPARTRYLVLSGLSSQRHCHYSHAGLRSLETERPGPVTTDGWHSRAIYRHYRGTLGMGNRSVGINGFWGSKTYQQRGILTW